MNFNKHNENHNESFESLVDIFTLLSITLIVASIIFGIYKTQTNQTENTLTEVELSKIKSGSKSSYQVNIPDNEVILVLSKKNRSTILSIINNKDSKSIITLPNNKNIVFNILNKEVSNLLKNNHFTLILSMQDSNTPYSQFTMIQEWLTNNGHTNITTDFWQAK